MALKSSDNSLDEFVDINSYTVDSNVISCMILYIIISYMNLYMNS